MTELPRAAGILGLGVCVPDNVVTNQDLAAKVETSDEWITTRTGIKERRIAPPEIATSDLAAEAGRRALAAAGLQPTDLDLIITATFTPDMICPSAACMVAEKLGTTRAGAMDLNAACTGFIYGLTIAKSLILTGVVRHVLVVGVETMSRYVDWSDRTTCVLFGDGAGAAVVGPVEPPRGILSEFISADGCGSRLIHVPAGGSAMPPTAETVRDKKHFIQMEGKEVFRFATKIMGEACDKALERAGLTADQIDLLVPHQANIRIIDYAAKRYGLTGDRVMVNIDRYGNTSAASIPIALFEAQQQGRIAPGKIVALVAFGAGLTWGANIIRW